MKIAIQKVVGDMGEVWMIEVPVDAKVLSAPDPVAAIKAKIGDVLRVADDRLYDINMRLMEHNKLAQQLSPEGMLAVRQCVAIMYGRNHTPDVNEKTQPSDAHPAAQAGANELAAKLEKAVGKLDGALEAVDQGGR